MATLHLHIGHNKTGSTWLQAALEASRPALADVGLDYPVRAEPRADQRRFDQWTGNGLRLLADAAQLAEALASPPGAPGRDRIYSSEVMLPDGAELEALDLAFLPRLAGEAGFDRVRVLLFVRDPMPHAVSAWQQTIKGWTGDVHPIDPWLTERYAVPAWAARAADRLEAVGAELTVRNYSRCADRLGRELCDWLGIAESVLTPPAAERLNRSLCAAEAQLQLQINRAFGSNGGRVFGHRAVAELPDWRGTPVRPSEAAQRAALARLAPALDALDARMPPEHACSREILAPAAGEGPPTLSEAHFRILGDGLVEEMERLRAEREALLADPARGLDGRALLRALAARIGRRLGRRR